jgi:hypothetical protein
MNLSLKRVAGKDDGAKGAGAKGAKDAGKAPAKAPEKKG